jgi:hypothetical protein
MEQPTSPERRVVDVTGLSEEAIAVVDWLVTLLRRVPAEVGMPAAFSSREEWARAVREYAESHPVRNTEADWSRESIYDRRGE